MGTVAAEITRSEGTLTVDHVRRRERQDLVSPAHRRLRRSCCGENILRSGTRKRPKLRRAARVGSLQRHREPPRSGGVATQPFFYRGFAAPRSATNRSPSGEGPNDRAVCHREARAAGRGDPEPAPSEAWGPTAPASDLSAAKQPEIAKDFGGPQPRSRSFASTEPTLNNDEPNRKRGALRRATRQRHDHGRRAIHRSADGTWRLAHQLRSIPYIRAMDALKQETRKVHSWLVSNTGWKPDRLPESFPRRPGPARSKIPAGQGRTWLPSAACAYVRRLLGWPTFHGIR